MSNQFFSRKEFFFFVSLALFMVASCETPRFDPDRRQIAAKDAIRQKLRRATAFDITAFREDTLAAWTDTNIKKPILYTIDFNYKDSTGTLQRKRGSVLFTPDGKSIIETLISY